MNVLSCLNSFIPILFIIASSKFSVEAESLYFQHSKVNDRHTQISLYDIYTD